MLLFRNTTIVSLLLCRMRTAQLYVMSMLPCVLFFRQMWLFLDLVGGQNLLLAGGGFFGYFRNILAENLADFCANLNQCLVHEKAVKVHLILYRIAKLIVSECVRSFVSVPAASAHRKTCVWLGFSDQIVPQQVDVVDVC